MTPEQTALLALVAVALVQAIKVLWMGLGGQPKPPAVVLQAIVFVISVALAFFWTPVGQLPVPAADPVAYALALLAAAGVVFLAAGGIYVVLLEALLKGLDGALFGRKVLAP